MADCYILSYSKTQGLFTREDHGLLEVFYKRSNTWVETNNHTTIVEVLYFSKTFSPRGRLLDQKTFSEEIISQLGAN